MYQVDPDRDSRFGAAYSADQQRKTDLFRAGLETGARVKAAGENYATVGPYSPSSGSGYQMAGDLLGRVIGGLTSGSSNPYSFDWQQGFRPGLDLLPGARRPSTSFSLPPATTAGSNWSRGFSSGVDLLPNAWRP